VRLQLATFCCAVLAAATAVAFGGGLYEALIVNPLWSRTPPASFAAIQPGTGVPLQTFWFPVHVAISVAAVAALALAWDSRSTRSWLFVGIGAYAAMRLWSATYFIPEMLAFQQVSPAGAPTLELLARVDRWTTFTLWRAPLDLLALAAFTGALVRLARKTRPAYEDAWERPLSLEPGPRLPELAAARRWSA
jgi:hypothetical protein